MSEDPAEIELESLHSEKKVSICDRKTDAIHVRNAYKHYGSKKNPLHVLNGLNMTLPRGAIYGLLGASGCGKTTLLNAIVGRRQLDSGQVWVLGGTPGTKECEVLGNRLGYMPQDMALYGEFTIRETLVFYGWVAGMQTKKIKERIEFLVNLLMLPKASSKVETLSTGQQRRVSLAAALIHEPELLILDEPTVGVDPVLRQIIWDHFLDIISNGVTSVIITTHYIDETRQANLIGLMRKGILLAEQAPETLVEGFNAVTLEEVFLKLSIVQNTRRGKRVSLGPQSTSPTASTSKIEAIGFSENEIKEITDGADNVSLYKYPYNHNSVNEKSQSIFLMSPTDLASMAYSYYRMNLKFAHVKALVWKNFLWITSHVPILIFALLAPFVQMALFFLCIGHFPTDLRIATVNYESRNDVNCNNTLFCNSSRLSCSYFSYLEKRGLHLIYYDSEEEAVQSVLKGNNYASIVVQKNYSDAIRKRVFKWGRTKDWDIKYANVDVVRDVSNKAIANFLLFYLYDSFLYFVQDYMVSCNWKKKALALPVDIVDPPVYGQRYPDFTEFVVPGIIVTTSFIAGIGLTAGIMLVERSEGNLHRYFVTGITGLELLIAHGASQVAALIYQILVTMVSAFVIFDLTNNGSYVLVIIIQLLVSFCGMCFGFVISTFVRSEQTALQIAMGSFIPVIALGGIAWPVEAMHRWLKPLTYFLPLTQTSDSLRSILHRGWDLTYKNVYMGFVSISLWICICLIVCIVCIRYFKE